MSTRRFLPLYVQLLSAQPFVVASRVNGNLSDGTYSPTVKTMLSYPWGFKSAGTPSLFCCNNTFGLLGGRKYMLK